MKITHWALGSAVVAAGLAVGFQVIGQSVPAALDIAQEPLYLKSQVAPAFIMAVDDSGSMELETLFATKDGALYWGGSSFYQGDGTNYDQVGNEFALLFPHNNGVRRDEQFVPAIDNFGVARSPEYNPGYYNPATTYAPWKTATIGSPWANASPTAAQTEPRGGASNVTFNLTSDVTDGYLPFDFRSGMRLPVGTKYKNVSCDTGRFGNGTSWTTVASTTSNTNRTINSTCEMRIAYYPATYFLTSSTSPDGSTGTLVADSTGGKPNLYKYEIKLANYGTGTGAAATAAYNAAIQNFANWFQYYRNRRLGTVAAMTHALETQRDMRVGYFQINDYSSATPVMRDMNDATARAGLYNSITNLSFPAVGAQGTPNRQAVARLGQQFDTRTGNDAPIVKACQINAGMLFTDGFSNSGGTSPTPGDNTLGAPFADNYSNTMADIAAHYYNKTLRSGAFTAGKVEVPAACTDAGVSAADKLKLDCRTDLHMNFYGITLGALAEIYGTGNYRDDPATPVDEAYNAAFATPPTWGPAGNDNPDAVDEIWHSTINARGKFINATNPASITKAMKDVLQSVADKNPLSGSQSVTGTRLNAGSFNVTPAFGRRNGGKDWYSTLTANRINPADGSNGAQLWEAAAELDSLGPAARNIWTATSNVTNANRGTAVVAFNSTNLNAASVGVSATTLTAYGVDVDQLFNYLRGDRTLEGTKLRSRNTRLGDIVNSAPQIAAAKDDYGWAHASGLPEAQRTAYTTYLTGNTGKKNRQSFVYVGANDGMLHAFEGDQPCTVSGAPAMCTPNSAGREAFAYVPNNVLANVGALANPDYTHKYYVDGNIAIGDAYNGTEWKTVLVGASGAGGRGVFGLDISNPGSFGASDVRWEVNATTDADMGHVMGDPVIAPIKDGAGGVQWVAIVPNGYNSNSSNPALFMIDIFTGAVVNKIIPTDGNNSDANGLGNIAAIDTDDDGLVDTVYGGDLLGNLWKFQLSGTAWGVAFSGAPLFTAVDSAGARQPITGGLEVSSGPGAGVSIFFGTGRYFVTGDNNTTSPQVQSLYSIWDNGSVVGGTGRSKLQVQTISVQTAGTPDSRQSSMNPVNYANMRGWYMDLKVGTAAANGERFIGTPRLQNGKVFFTTFVPLQDECDPDGTNWLYSLDALTGAAAMNQVSLSPTGNPQACSGNCGAISLSSGGPVRDTSVLLPPPTPLPGLVGGCVPGSPGCVTPTTPTFQRCTLVIRAAGAPPLYLPRPCGRQSWRQIR